MRHALTRILPYAPRQMFDLVADVQSYPQFVPWLTTIRVFNPRSDGEAVRLVDAEAQVGFAFLRERFTTQVRADAAAPRVDVSLISGPFKHLKNRWLFEPHPVGTLLRFDIDFEFRSRLLDRVASMNFDRAASRLVGCFETRARALYAPVDSAPEAVLSA